MISLQRGNLLESGADAIVNTVNCVGVMGKGIALQFRQAWPENFREYRKACEHGEVRLGRMFIVATGQLPPAPRFIVNFPTKDHWKSHSRIEDIERGLEDLVAQVRALGIRSIAVPPLGCGLGGLDWNEVRPRIERHLGALEDLDVFLYEPGGAPDAKQQPTRTKRPMLTRAKAMLLASMRRYMIFETDFSKLEVQKVAYFLQVAGEDLKLPFERAEYGPYAERLNHVLQQMEGHYTRGYGDRTRRSQIEILPGVGDEAERALGELDGASTVIERFAALIEGFESAHSIELLATTHRVMTEPGARPDDLPWVTEQVHAWNERKRARFPAWQVKVAWEHLRASQG